MQYYKLLAKEVEKRILLLKPFNSGSESDLSEDKTDAPELPESEQNYELPLEDLISLGNEKLACDDNEKLLNRSVTNSPKYSSLSSNNSDKITSNLTPITDPLNETSKLVIDLSFSINQSDESTLHEKKALSKETPSDVPEHDNESPIKTAKQKQKPETEAVTNHGMQEVRENKPKFKTDNKDTPIDEFLSYIHQDGPPSLSAKSFTGSLNDLHKDSGNSTQTNPLIRQRSYTVLTPSPLLLAHLQIQSLSTGVDMTSISMSESLSNLSSPNKKRRSWDLETAKAKWSTMALELNKKNITVNVAVSRNGDGKPNLAKKRMITRPEISRTQPAMSRSRSVDHRNTARNITSKSLPKSESVQRNRTTRSPSRVTDKQTMSLQNSICKDVNNEPSPQKAQPTSECDDPGRRVRELYERIQKQQLMQMATLVEKQKKEQLLLQQVFEEQNSLLYNQLKTICPKSSSEVKEAWADKSETVDRGPVSLSQLISHKSSLPAVHHSPGSCALTDTNNYLNLCDNVLKKSRDITGSIKKQHADSKSENSPQLTHKADGTRPATRSLKNKNLNTSRKLTYETSASSDREYDLILTDRTNDTMADLNVTFPSDTSNDHPRSQDSSATSKSCGKDAPSAHQTLPTKDVPRSSESAIRSVEDTIKNSILDVRARLFKKDLFRSPTAQERAAATKIVAYAKGYLVRRLMRTERVQSTVQTIRDALLCALQLHQDREGIRGADVDLHRRLLQQITAACYSLHDTFVGSTPAERCALLAADRSRRRALALRPAPHPRAHRPTDLMSHSHTGTFPPRPRRCSPTSAMTQSNHESFSGEKAGLRARCVGSPRRRPWR
ncbi:serine-rich adhesin for platelets isoform X2 [Battus philenor]